MSQRVVIFGSAGQVGVELVREFQTAGYQAIALERPQVDITDRARVERAVAEADPAVVVNTAAYNMVDVAESEPQAAYLVNGLAVRNLALAARQVDARLVHFSTDYVFDGAATRPYVETDQPHPLGAYAVSKYAGELYAQAYLERPLIVRTSGVFGPGALHTNRGNFVELMLRLAKGSSPIRVVEDHVGTPTFAPELAKRVVELITRKAEGVFHVGGNSPITWYEFAKKIFARAGLTPELRATNEREYRTPARRPRYSALRNQRIEELGLAPMPSLDAALDAYLAATGRV